MLDVDYWLSVMFIKDRGDQVASESVCTFLRFNVFFKIQKTSLFTFFELLHTFSRTLPVL